MRKEYSIRITFQNIFKWIERKKVEMREWTTQHKWLSYQIYVTCDISFYDQYFIKK